MSDDLTHDTGRRRAGQFAFALGFVLISVLLLVLLGDQTDWKPKTKLFAQPRFWPAVGVIGMVVFGGLHLRLQPRRRVGINNRREGRVWASSIEYAVWFFAYVWLVPIFGYLPTTLVFAPALTWRLGYKSPKMLWISVVFGFCVVVVFKSVLEVKIPGGMIYEYLPGALRSFFILNF